MKWGAINRIIGGSLLVSGTCIGAGMLGLPISTAAGGFYPSLLAFLFCWGMMTLSAFLMLEISLQYPEETNLITMARATLGKGGAYFAWFCYLFFLYSLMAAYTSGASGILSRVFTHFGWLETLSLPIFVGFFSIIVYLGARWVDSVNRVMMLGLIAAYIALIWMAIPEVETVSVRFDQAKYLWMAGPLLVTSFGFHLLIPSLKNYMHSHVKELRLSIFFGSLLPLVVYLLWEYIILGVVPLRGPDGLIAMNQTEQPILNLTHALSVALDNKLLTFVARFFSFCAILTSFIGVSLGLFDFLADGFKVEKNRKNKLFLAAMTFLPPVCFVWVYPAGFLLALRYAGIFAAILLVMYPAFMVWSSRYCLKNRNVFQVWGGKPILLIAIVFGGAIIFLEILQELTLLPVPIP